jgi:hypothetical protein
MSTFDFPPSSMAPPEAERMIRGRCELLGLDYERVAAALRTGGMVVRVAIMRHDEAARAGGPWPPEHVRAARSQFRANNEQSRQVALDDLEAARPESLVRMGRALVEWSGIDPDSNEAIEQLADAIGFSSIPDAARTIAESEQEDS